MSKDIESETSGIGGADLPEHGKVRWRRFAAAMVTAVAAAFGLLVLTAQGAVAVQFSVSGMPFTVAADRLDGTGFEQFATLDLMVPNSPNEGTTGGYLVLVVSAIHEATLTNLCQTVSLGGEYLKITAGDNGTPVTATNLVVDGDEITAGDAQFTNINIGQDASTLNEVPGVVGNAGVFAQQADNVTLTNLRQNNYATTAAAFRLPGLHLSFTKDGC
ncbi:MAG TPA: DUF6230 family protein [Micromonosporaceae bacterium]